ncbi:unnamed protein product [Allacma fusca]|uniref:THAP4-like heme-binding domain-containing protein n=1 Tax=Allacma fusca TaxID=39272 RepID=A0A8J2PZN9_9HEXA|nr:unnamed protein product [Allacma fusca]
MSGETLVPQRLLPISWIIGTWESISAEGKFPTIQPFHYKELIEFRCVGAQPLLKYTASTKHTVSGNPMHQESGFLRMRGEHDISFMVAHNFGLTTIEEGSVENNRITLRSTADNITRMSPDSAKSSAGVKVTELKRRFILDLESAQLVQEVFMATEETPELTLHLCATYSRTSC